MTAFAWVCILAVIISLPLGLGVLIGMAAARAERRTALATANDNTGNLRAVQNLARHSRPETTSRYTRTKERTLRAVVESIDY